MKPYDLKQYIIDNDKIIDILEWLGCHHIKKYTKRYCCALPERDNPTAVSVKRHNLRTNIFSESMKFQGDIIAFVMELNNCSFPKASKDIHNLLNLKYTFSFKDEKKNEKKDILDVFKKAQKRHLYSNEDLHIYEEDICREFIQIPYIGWIREGIMPFTQKEFGIGYSRLNNRVCIPWRYWCGNLNQYTGIIGRTLNENFKELEIPKYFPLISFPKSMNIYGLQENYKHIQKAGVCIIFEAEKSVLKCHSLGIKNAVALGGHELSHEHIKILLSLDVTLIFAMDKDMSEELSIDMCNKVKMFRKTGYIYDEFGLLGKKDSAIDKGLKIFKVLLNRVTWVKQYK